MNVRVTGETLMDVSILVCAYNMARELPRTLFTLSRDFQRDLADLAYEVVVLDNGSNPPVDEAALQKVLPGVRVVRPQTISVSPAAAINAAMRDLHGRLIGLWIDGARLSSPGLVRLAVEAWEADPAKAIATLAFHLGPDVQMRSVFKGYDARVEDMLLGSVPWREDGYRLFDISVLAGSSVNGWFGCINETNGLFMDRSLWDALGGLDERFRSPGGGLVNLDLWQRAVAASGNRPWMILGEGSFHQVHGGAATNGTADDREVMHVEYADILGQPFPGVDYRANYVGKLDAARLEAGTTSTMERHRKAHTVGDRRFRFGLPAKALESIQKGTLRASYKGLSLTKSPFDLALYTRLIGNLKPATIIEFGSSGGSTVWLQDQCRAQGLEDTMLIVVNLAASNVDQSDLMLDQGDEIAQAPHPWLVIEGSAQTYEATQKVLDFFDTRLAAGDMIVVEGGIMADLEGEVYRQLDDGLNRAVADFLERTHNTYRIDEELCDFYGPNATYAPNGWLRRM